MTEVTCTNCGSRPYPTDDFCAVCGTKLQRQVAKTKRRKVPLLVAIGLVVVVGVGAVYFLAGRSPEIPVTTGDTPRLESPDASPAASESPATAAVDTLDIKTEAGVLRIQSVELDDKYQDCPINKTCREFTGAPYLRLVVRSTSGKSAREIQDSLVGEPFESFVRDSKGLRADHQTTQTTTGTRNLELIYAEFESMSVTGLVLFWPGNSPIKLNPK